MWYQPSHPTLAKSLLKCPFKPGEWFGRRTQQRADTDSSFCWLSRPMKLILFISMFMSVDTGCDSSFPPWPRHTVSGMFVLCARYSFHASFVASQAPLINKTPPPLFFFLLLLSIRRLSVSGLVSAVRQLVINACVGLGEASCSSHCRVDREAK